MPYSTVSVLRNAIREMEVVYTTSISRYWISGIPVCYSVLGNVALACNQLGMQLPVSLYKATT